MKRILVGVDGSAPSERAVELAAQLALPVKALVKVVYVVNPYTYPLQAYPAEFVDVEAAAEVTRQERRLGELITQAAAERLHAQGLDAQTQVLSGNPPVELAEAAARESFDLVVVGSTGKGALKRMLLGSTSHRLLQLSECPVLVVQ